MKLTFNGTLGSLGMAALLVACSGTQPLVSTPIENIDTMPLKIEELTEKEKQHWGHADLVTDTIPGMSVDKAYAELLGNKKGKTIIVAVLDSGMDLEHEDLDDVLWTNKKEIAGNGKDDDGNGYIDDVHGYNFLGDSYDENLEMTRIVKLKLGDAALQTAAQNELNEKLTKDSVEKTQIGAIYSAINEAHQGVAKALGKEDYSQEELRALAAKDANMIQNSGILSQAFAFAQNIPDATNIPDVLEEMKGYVDYLTESVDYNLNVAFDGRKVVGDNPYDIKDTKYGNGNPSHVKEDESHGTHVAGIIAAERNNGLGANGVANNVELMSIRAVPNGDEYDKDIALGIRYAVDNGAKIINCSFGKSYSPNADWVYDALKYAAKKDVLIVHAAGNDGKDLDDPANPNFPNDQIDNGPEMANNVITVGALAPKYGPEMVASFSNYGKINVDVLAPGAKIYSTVPESKYKTMGGTSMAAPAVAGVAAVVWGKYPTLKAAQIKKIIMESGVSFNTEVIVAGDDSNVKSFGDITTSGKMANLYNALILAEQVSKGKVNL